MITLRRAGLWLLASAGVLWGAGGPSGSLLALETGLSPLAVAAYRLAIGGTLIDIPTVASSATAGPTVAECDVKLARYRAALEADADPAVVAGWIAETQAERQRAEQLQHTPVEEESDIPSRLVLHHHLASAVGVLHVVWVDGGRDGTRGRVSRR